MPHDMLIGTPATGWEFGTRDTGAYATISNVAAYIDYWLGGEVSGETDPRKRIEAAGRAIHTYETHLTAAIINGIGNLPGLRDMEHVTILAGHKTTPRAPSLNRGGWHGLARDCGDPEQAGHSHPHLQGGPLQRKCAGPARPAQLHSDLAMPL